MCVIRWPYLGIKIINTNKYYSSLPWYCLYHKKKCNVVSVAELQLYIQLAIFKTMTNFVFVWITEINSYSKKEFYTKHVVHWEDGIWFYLNKWQYFTLASLHRSMFCKLGSRIFHILKHEGKSYGWKFLVLQIGSLSWPWLDDLVLWLLSLAKFM